MAFESNKDVTWFHPAGMVSQSLDGNIFISRYIKDFQPLEKMGQIFPCFVGFFPTRSLPLKPLLYIS